MRVRSWFTLLVPGLALLMVVLGGPLPQSPTLAQERVTAAIAPRDAAGADQIKGRTGVLASPGVSIEPMDPMDPALLGARIDAPVPLDIRSLLGVDRTAHGQAPSADAPAALACTVGTLAAGSAADGRLDDADCRLPQVIGGDNPSYADQYVLTLAERGRLTVNVGRRDFDPYVAILDDQYYVIAESTSAGAAAEARLTLPPGTYIVVVGAASGDPDTQGAYRVTTSLAPEAKPASCSADTLAPGGSVNGAFVSTDCRLFDVLPDVFSDPHVEIYVITLPAAGALRLEMRSTALQPLIILADPAFVPFAADRAPAASPNTLISTTYLRAGTYLVLATSVSVATGDFTLTATFTPSAADCAPEDAATPSSLTGQLATDGCHLAFLPNDAYDQSPVALYRIVLPQAGEFELTVRATGFTPVVRAFNHHYDMLLNRPLSAPAGSTTLRASLIWPYARTLYLAVSAAEGGSATGDFTADIEFTPDGSACSFATLDPTAAVDGQLAITDCILADVDPEGLSYNSRVDQYYVTVNQRGRLNLAMTSPSFETHLMAFDENWVLMAADAAASGTKDTALDLVVHPGTYIILATSNAAAAGSYRVTAGFQALPPPASCPIQPIQPTAEITGDLTAAACRVTDVRPDVPTQEHVQRYRLTLPGRGAITLAMQGLGPVDTKIDSVLEIYDAATGELIARNDDIAPPDTDAQIETVLPKGEYIVHATTPKLYGGVTTGPYRLTTQFTAQPAPASCPMEDLALDEVVQGSIDADADCRLFDTSMGGFASLPVHLRRLHVPQAGVLTVDLQALGFNPLLAIYDPRWTLLRANDDAIDGVTEDSQIVWNAPPGIYTVAAISSDVKSGDYLLETQFEPEAYVPPATATPTRTVRTTPTGATPTRESTPTVRPPGDGKIYLPYGVRVASPR
jgi:hypothetical protein